MQRFIPNHRPLLLFRFLFTFVVWIMIFCSYKQYFNNFLCIFVILNINFLIRMDYQLKIGLTNKWKINCVIFSVALHVDTMKIINKYCKIMATSNINPYFFEVDLYRDFQFFQFYFHSTSKKWKGISMDWKCCQLNLT